MTTFGDSCSPICRSYLQSSNTEPTRSPEKFPTGAGATSYTTLAPPTAHPHHPKSDARPSVSSGESRQSARLKSDQRLGPSPHVAPLFWDSLEIYGVGHHTENPQSSQRYRKPTAHRPSKALSWQSLAVSRGETSIAHRWRRSSSSAGWAVLLFGGGCVWGRRRLLRGPESDPIAVVPARTLAMLNSCLHDISLNLDAPRCV